MGSLSRMRSSCVVSCETASLCRFLWSKLPIDMLIEVLSRLPEKPLLQLRCVSKTFHYLITKLFIPGLAAYAPLSGFIFQWEKRRYPFSASPPHDFVPGYGLNYVASCSCVKPEFVSWYVSLLPFKMVERDDFLGCFNGIMLVTDSSSPSACVPYYLCNPATKQLITIPPNPTHLKAELESKNPFVGLAFDPLDPPPHHFKIVRITHLNEMDVFSSSTGEWVKHALHFDPDEVLKFELVRHSVYLNGVLYMLSMANYLLCFDLGESYNTRNKPKTRSIKLPHTSRRKDYIGLLEASNRYLFYVGQVNLDWLVWIFKVNNEASPWLLKYRINLRELAKLPIGRSLPRTTIVVYSVDLREEIILFGDIDFVLSYNIKNNQLDLFHLLDEDLYDVSDDCKTIFRAKTCFYSYSRCLVKLPE